MQKLIMKNLRGIFVATEYSDEAISMLGDFLTDDVGRDASHWKKLLENPKDEETGSNLFDIITSGDQVTISHSIIPSEAEFITTRKILWELLDQWEKLAQSLPDEILIEQENDSFKLTAKKNGKVYDAKNIEN